jgi:hypothetical protein
MQFGFRTNRALPGFFVPVHVRATESTDEKKPAYVGGLNPYQEETWRRQFQYYTRG